MEEADNLNIDYKTLYEKVADELTQARLAILELRRTQGPFGNVSGDSIRSWANRNYLVILVVVMLGTFIISSLHTLWELMFTTKGGGNSSGSGLTE